jgi:DNA-binding MarR family transcriptional regulator
LKIELSQKENPMKDQTVAVVKDKLRVLERVLGWEFGDQSECCGLTNAQRTVLIELGGKGRMSLVDLVQRLGLDASTLSRTLNGLVNIGLVRRQIKAEDRRYITLSLTPQGQGAFRRIEKLVDDYLREVLSVVPVAKQKGIAESLSLLAEALIGIRRRGEPCALEGARNIVEANDARDKKSKR